MTMCRSTVCPKRETCHRFRAEANKYRQSYFAEPPHSEGKCEYYIEVKNEK